MIATKQVSVLENDLDYLAEHFENSSVEEVLEWAVEQHAPKLVMTSNFGAEGVVSLDGAEQPRMGKLEASRTLRGKNQKGIGPGALVAPAGGGPMR